MSAWKLGDEVEWASSAAGVRRVKRGAVVEVVPAGKWPGRYRVGDGMARDHESYVVRAYVVGRGSRKGTYWPRVKALLAATVET
jgi:hypothetical protein